MDESEPMGGREADVETYHRSSINTVTRSEPIQSKNCTPFLFLFGGRPRIVSSGQPSGGWRRMDRELQVNTFYRRSSSEMKNRSKFITVNIASWTASFSSLWFFSFSLCLHFGLINDTVLCNGPLNNRFIYYTFVSNNYAQ